MGRRGAVCFQAPNGIASSQRAREPAMNQKLDRAYKAISKVELSQLDETDLESAFRVFCRAAGIMSYITCLMPENPITAIMEQLTLPNGIAPKEGL